MRGGHFLLLFLILSVVSISGVSLTSVFESDDVEETHEILPDLVQNGVNQATLNGVLFKTLIRYFCLPLELRENSTTILYGTNGWTFPKQDVNLTLSYPTSNKDVQREIDLEYYKIAGYQVILFTDGLESSGVIASGGLMNTHITLNFNMSSITMLSYEFWLYGVPATQAGSLVYLNHHQLC